MAITKVIEIDVDELKAVGGLSNLDKAIEQSEQTTKSLKTQIREATQELIKAQNEFGDYSQAALDAAKKVATLKDKIQEAKETSDLFDPGAKFQALTGALSVGANVVQTYQASINLLGIESEGASEALLKVQSAMALSQGVSQLADSAKDFNRLVAVAKQYTVVQKLITAGQWLWNAAMNANPIGAITVAIGALIAVGYKLTKYFMDSAEVNDKAAAATKLNTKALETQSKEADKSSNKLKSYNQYQYDMAKASGASAESLRKLALKHKDEEIALNLKNTMLARSTFLRERDTLASLKNADASDEVIKAQEKLTQETFKEFNKQRDGYYKSKEEKVALIRQQHVEIKQAETNAANELEKKRKEAREKEKEELKKKAEEDKKFLEDKLKREIQYREDFQNLQNRFNEIAKEEQENAGKLLEDAIAKDNARLENAYNVLNGIKENEKLSISERLADNEFYTNQLLSNTELTQDQIDAIKAKSAENEKELNKLKNEAIIADGFNTLNAIANLAGEGTALAKAVSVAQATMSGYEGVVNAYKTAQKSPITVFFPGYPVLQAGLAGAFAAMNIKKILSVQKPSAGGGGGSVGSMSNVGGGSVPAPQFNVVGNAGVNQLQATLGAQQPVQAYVVANNVTTAQAMNRNIIQNASLG